MFRRVDRVAPPLRLVGEQQRAKVRAKRLLFFVGAIAVIVSSIFAWTILRPTDEAALRTVPGVVISPPPSPGAEDGASPAPFSPELLNEGSFVYPESGKKVTVTLDEPLPSDARTAVEEALSEFDFSVNGAYGAVRLLSETVGFSGKQFVVIYPAVVSCDGVEFFNGYAIAGSFPPPRNDSDAADRCESMRTLDGVHALVDTFTNSDPYTKGTFEIFESGMDKADDIYEKNKQTPAPEAEEGLEFEPVKPIEMTPDERQTYAGTF